jgi:hypothetical protein
MIHRLLLSTFLLLAVTVPARAELQFTIPDGWADLSPGKPIPAGVPESVSAVTQSGTYALYAMDLGGAKKDNFAENMNVIVRQRPLVADARTLQQLVASLPAQAAQEVPGAKLTVLEQSVVPVAGVPALRVVLELANDESTMRTLEYMISGGDSTAQVSYSSSPAEFARYLPIFEAAVQKTTGVAAPPLGARLGSKLLATGMSAEDAQTWLVLGGRVLGVVVFVLVFTLLARRSKRRSASA